MRALAVAVASLIMANGVIITEEATGWDLGAFIEDGISDARAALARALEPDGDDQAVVAGEKETTSTTAAATSSSTSTTSTAPTTTSTPATTPAPGGKPATTPKPTTATTAKPGKPAPTPTTGAAPRPGTVPAVNSTEQVLGELRLFVQKERGLDFKSPVKIVTLADAPFKSRLAEYRLGAAKDEAKRIQGALRALGIIEPDVDLAAQINRLSTGTSQSFYDTGANELVVRGDITTAFARKILVHELTHALNDQHFELHRPGLRANEDESAQAFESLMEGIAGRVEERYVASMPEDDKKAVQAEQQRLAAQFPRDLPQYVFVSFGFPYTAGLRLANALVTAGGQGRLDSALREPPTTTEQILHPERYIAGEGAKPLGAPPADGPVVVQGSLGQLTLSLMLAEGLEAGYAEGAADGWGADRYVAWEAGGQTCVRLSVDMDNPQENAELNEALVDWAAETPGAVVEGTGPFTVTRCA